MKRIFFVLIFIFLFPHTLLAEEIIQIDQAKIRLSISPGKAKTGIINIANPSMEKKDIRVYLEDWYYIPPYDGSKEFRPAGSLQNSCSSWISFSPAEFSLPPFGKKTVNYTVRLPEEAEGGHYAVLFFEELLGKPKIEEGVGVGVAVRIGVLFYIEPEGKIKRLARLEDILIDKKDGSLEIKVELENIGNTDITAKSNFHIIDNKGMVYVRGKFNDVYTFPKDRVKLSSKSAGKLKEGIYDLVITLQFEGGGVQVFEVKINVDSQGRIKAGLPKS